MQICIWLPYHIKCIYIYHNKMECGLNDWKKMDLQLRTSTVDKAPKDKQTNGTTNSFNTKANSRTEVMGASTLHLA